MNVCDGKCIMCGSPIDEIDNHVGIAQSCQNPKCEASLLYDVDDDFPKTCPKCLGIGFYHRKGAMYIPSSKGLLTVCDCEAGKNVKDFSVLQLDKQHNSEELNKHYAPMKEATDIASTIIDDILLKGKFFSLTAKTVLNMYKELIKEGVDEDRATEIVVNYKVQ